MRRGLLISLTLAIVPSAHALAQARYSLIADPTRTSVFGAQNLAALHRLSYWLEYNIFKKTRWFDERGAPRKALGVTLRLTKVVLVEDVADYLAVIVQHELYGHGSRLREFGIRPGFSIHLPPPYGSGGGSTSWSVESNQRLTPHEEVVVYLAGVEGNAILGQQIRYNWLLRGNAHHREAVLYFRTANNLALYAWSTKAGNRFPGNDVLAYLADLNSLEGYPDSLRRKLTLDGLTAQTLVNVLNPFNLFAVYTFLVRYVWLGERDYELPMLRIGKNRYLPSLRLGLTPFGSEFYLENLVRSGEAVWNLYARLGDPTFHTFGGVGFAAVNVGAGPGRWLDGRVDLWHQPALALGGAIVPSSGGGLGGALGATLYQRVPGTSFLDLAAGALAKTSGFLEGERLRRGVTFRVGVSFREGARPATPAPPVVRRRHPVQPGPGPR